MIHDAHAAVTVYDGKHIRLVRRNSWEYVSRKNLRGIVGIVAVTDTGRMLLVEQWRPPLMRHVIELPAGLAGDLAGHEGEDLETAARRELLEETGYEAVTMEELADGTVSAGITDEIITLFRATGLKKVSDADGDGSEQITLHEIEVGRVESWLNEERLGGKSVDLKVYAGLYFAK
jgi:ADP-ribose pyrophosphatase